MNAAGGRCQIGGRGVARALRLMGVSSRGRDAGHLAPGAEGMVASGTMFGGGQAVVTKLEMVVDAAVGGEEALRVTR